MNDWRETIARSREARLRATETLLEVERLWQLGHMMLVCHECKFGSDRRARGWRAYLTVDDQVVVYCPDCAEEEFDE